MERDGSSKSDEYHELRLSGNIFPNNVDNNEDTGPVSGVISIHYLSCQCTKQVTADNYHCVISPVGLPVWWFRREKNLPAVQELVQFLS